MTFLRISNFLDISNCNDISNFCAMFPNNVTAEQFSLVRTKSTYAIINHGLSPYFKELLTENGKLSDCLIIYRW